MIIIRIVAILFIIMTIMRVLGWCAKYWLKRSLQAKFAQAQAASAHTQPQTAEPMVQCADCGLYVPKPEALFKQQQAFCSRAHAKHG